MRAKSKSLGEIAKDLRRSVSVIYTFLKNPDRYVRKNNGGRPPKLPQLDKRIVKRDASKWNMSARDLVNALDLNIGHRRVQKILREEPKLQYKKIREAPRMTETRMKLRVEWAKAHVSWTLTPWAKVIFSDEKKFNLDGPDGWAYYWHDVRKEEQIFSKRQNGGGSLMIWGAFCFHKTSKLALVEGTINSTEYCSILEEYLLPAAASMYGTRYIFQQDNASPHTSHARKQWFESKGIDVLRWPAKSPDLNPIENMWGILARSVYRRGRQFSTVEELKEIVFKAWDEISDEICRKLVKPMNNRCIEVLAQHGKKTKY